jgi:Ulp1 family protease
MPRQRNGYDCGVYVCAVALAVAQLLLLQGGDVSLTDWEAQRLAQDLTPCQELRSNMLQIIGHLQQLSLSQADKT